MSVPVIGIVENMSAFVCPHCGEATEIFGRGGGEKFAERNELEYFGGVPIDVKVRQGGDAGVPAVAQREPGPAAEVLRALARTVAARMSVRAAQQHRPSRSASQPRRSQQRERDCGGLFGRLSQGRPQDRARRKCAARRRPSSPPRKTTLCSSCVPAPDAIATRTCVSPRASRA